MKKQTKIVLAILNFWNDSCVINYLIEALMCSPPKFTVFLLLPFHSEFLQLQRLTGNGL